MKAPAWQGLRPTSDKLRETLFNILGSRVHGATFLDAYAGTGAIGIEALSRGARHVTFIEQDHRARALIAANLAACRLVDGYTIESGDVAAVLKRLPDNVRFDVAVLDPPYEAAGVREALAAAALHLADGGVIVLERATRREPDVPAPLVRRRDVASGDSSLTLLDAQS